MDIHRLYKGAKTRLFSFSPILSSTSPTSSSSTQGSIQSLRASQSCPDPAPRPVGGLLYHRVGYCEAPGGKIPDRGNPPQASCSRAGYSYPQIRREGRIHLPLPPRARVRSSPLRPGVYVLLRTGFSRSSPRFFPPHLGVYHYV